MGRLLAHLLLHIVVEVVDRDRAVAVRVGLAAAQPLDQAAGEQRAGLRGAELIDAGRGSVSSNAYSSSSEAVRVTRPCPSKRCSTPAVSVLLGTSPLPNAPL